jgi:hypothetical protein
MRPVICGEFLHVVFDLRALEEIRVHPDPRLGRVGEDEVVKVLLRDDAM